VGAYEGFFNFPCEQRNAARVVAVDKFVWEWPGLSALKNFQAVQKSVSSRVERVSCSVEDLPSELNETFDIVLFLGVLYHTADMVGYLRNIHRLTKAVCVLETLVDDLDKPGSHAKLYSELELNGDKTNWWAPNLQALEIMLRRVGFRHIEFMNFWDVNTVGTLGGSMFGPIRSGRFVLHAYV